jgi:hypothetical protein
MKDAHYIHAERMARFAAHGLRVETGRYAGSIQFSAVESAKLLKKIDDLQAAKQAAETRLEIEIGNRPFLASCKE